MQKRNATPESICDGKAEQFIGIAREIYGYRYADEPDYNGLKQKFLQIIADNKL